MWNRPDAHITTDCGAIDNLLGPPANAPTNQAACAWALNNGTDLEMGGNLWALYLGQAVQQGALAIDVTFRCFVLF
jgi:hypothetical protein